MLYQWLETQRAMMRSFDAWAAFASAPWGASPAQAAEDHADAPYRGDARLASVALPGCDWLYRLLQAPPEPPPFAIDSVRIGGRTVPVSEAVVDRTPFCALRRFTREFDAVPIERGSKTHKDVAAASRSRGRTADLPLEDADAAGALGSAGVLLVTPLAGHHAVMLRETVETLLEDADVYVTDWADARDVPLAQGRFGLSDYVLIVERFLCALAERGVHVLAVCQAAPPALAAAALIAASDSGLAPLSITLMGGPIDARLHPTMIDRLAATHDIEWFRHTVIDTVPPLYAGAGRRIYPGYVQHAAIVSAHPHRQMALESRYWTSRMSGDARAAAASLRSLKEYSAVLDMDEDYFLDTLRIVFQEQRLARGTWSVGTRRVLPEALTATALCTVEGDRDDIAGADQTHAAHAVCAAVPDTMRMRMTIGDCDHYDLFTGPRWRETVHPALRAFWLEHASHR
ncbi:polyhydroxyalkanoate depolymerase [Trinickia dinghuensis]|uniref:Polyhydroxyalkanoate depolymerase n=1 Tax=Trinickia dinghuensis TaxID=2291023 RepID=A0A3D8K310_9BURK|nr:polyhydroxyalkanoate depolymerase [Trinickia dinghuensis]RDU99286.1 polyhydroxyalkanoate depolymerase [Trinickia dinghuensis]